VRPSFAPIQYNWQIIVNYKILILSS
jgi:hypothetical protein